MRPPLLRWPESSLTVDFIVFSRCVVKCEWIHGRVVYLNEEAERRDAGVSSLSNLPAINMVFDFLLDYMHLVCPSVMKKLLLHWIRSPLSTRLSNTRINFISNRFIATAEFFPRVCKEVKVFTWYRQMESYRIPPISIVHWPRRIKGHKELNHLLRLSEGRWKPSSRTKPCSIWWKKRRRY